MNAPVKESVAPGARRSPLPRHTLPHSPVVVVVVLRPGQRLARAIDAPRTARGRAKSLNCITRYEISGTHRDTREVRVRRRRHDHIYVDGRGAALLPRRCDHAIIAIRHYGHARIAEYQ